MKAIFSSDWHLFHRNILKYDNRPFKDIDHMNYTIITNTAKMLEKGDNFYYMGDFAMMSSMNDVEGMLKTLSYTGANLYFIKGNHDSSRDTVKLYRKYGTYLGEQTFIRVENQEIVLNHYAMRVWRNSHHGSWCLYGHSHDSLEYEKWGKSMDVGVVSAHRILGEYRPFTFKEIKKILDERPVRITDHHGRPEERARLKEK